MLPMTGYGGAVECASRVGSGGLKARAGRTRVAALRADMKSNSEAVRVVGKVKSFVSGPTLDNMDGRGPSPS